MHVHWTGEHNSIRDSITIFCKGPSMFDANKFKRSVKDWIRDHPEGTEEDLLDLCEELIPTNQYAANHWLIEHTLSWYRHILAQRKNYRNYSEEESALG